MTVPDHSSTPLPELMSLRDRVAVVTGAGNGIGAAIATRLAEAGARVTATDLDADAAAATAATITAAGHAATALQLDVTDSAAVDEVAAAAAAGGNRLDIWVNNAGIYPSRPFLEMTDDDWSMVLDVNLNGAFRGSRAAARQMEQHDRGGVIINIVSVSGYRGRKGLAHYSTSKHGLRGLTRSLAVELGPKDIRVLGIAPTMTLTPGIAAALPAETTDSDRHSTAVYNQLPLGRSALPDDIARVALFCASDLATLMTGTTLAVDAGQMSM